MQELDKYIDQIKSLPPGPRILPELLALLEQDDVEAGEVVRLIKFDPALTAKALQRCNSAQFGSKQAVHNLEEAVVRIGFGEIYRIVACVVGERTLGGSQQGYGIAQGELWKHCAVAAVAARLVAHETGEEESMVFTAGLLHDIGKLVLGTTLVGAYEALVKETESSGRSLQEAEKQILGVEHAEIGGRLLARWNFPENLVRAVWHHHDPVKAQPVQRLAACVHLGNLLAHYLGHGYGHQAYATRCRSEALELLGLKPGDLEQFLIKTAGCLGEVPSLAA